MADRRPDAPPTTPAVLVIEDDPFMLRSLEKVLANAGLSCTGCDALAPIAETIRGDAPQVAVVDWHLHGGNAADLIRTLGETYPDMPVVVHTGDLRAEVEREFRACGAWAWCSKGDGQLLHQIAMALAEHHRRVSRIGYPTMDEIQTTAVRGAMLGAGGNITAAARNLGMTPGRLRRLIRRLGAAA